MEESRLLPVRCPGMVMDKSKGELVKCNKLCVKVYPGSSATVTGLIPGKTYLVRTSSDWTEGKGEFRTNIKAGTTSLSMRPYNSNGPLTAVSYEDVITIPSGVTTATIQRAYSGEKVGVRIGATRVTFQIIG